MLGGLKRADGNTADGGRNFCLLPVVAEGLARFCLGEKVLECLPSWLSPRFFCEDAGVWLFQSARMFAVAWREGGTGAAGCCWGTVSC